VGKTTIVLNIVKPQKRFVDYSGMDRFSLGPDITAIPLFDLMQKILKQSN
jgi:hypothetical protein